MTEGGKYNPPAKTEPVTSPNLLPSPRKKKNQSCTRRFSDEQIRSLESVFTSETKLEPRKKLQLARELGLQPRQVSIWFQNRRARWKSKQIEQDYRALKANYDNLCFQLESLKEEKQSLLIQLQKLWDLLKNPQEGGGKRKDLERNSVDLDSDQGDGCGREFESKPSSLTNKLDNHLMVYSNDEERRVAENLGDEEEPKLGSIEAQADSSFVSPKKWCTFNSSGGFDLSCGSSNWWDFWT